MKNHTTKVKVQYLPRPDTADGEKQGTYVLNLDIEAAFDDHAALKQFVAQLPIPNSAALAEGLTPENCEVIDTRFNPRNFMGDDL